MVDGKRRKKMMNIQEKNNEGLLALQLGDNVQAEDVFLECLKHDDKSPQLWYNLGLAKFRQDMFEEAEECFKKAVKLDGGYTEAWAMLGTSRIEQKKFNEAELPLCKAENPECDALSGQISLGQGDIGVGFTYFEDRFQNKPENTWDGKESLIGKTLLIEGTEGLGDQIFFARWLRRVAELGAERVYLNVSEPLAVLFDNDFSGSFILTQTPPATDYCTNLGSLGYIFEDGIGTIPTAPYVAKSRHWQEDKPLQRIGLAWSGNILHLNDKRRSIPLPFFHPILNLPFAFTCVQKDIRAGDADYMQYTDMEKEDIEDVEDLAETITGQDLIITVDTLTANLAGALAVPTWVLVPYVCDWRWMFEGERTPWYPSVRVFRQGADRRWEPVIEKVCEELKKLGEQQ
jgi:tetratricopeptide (TPR) repeat protein